MKKISILFLLSIGCGGSGPSAAETKCLAVHGALCDRAIACNLETSSSDCLKTQETGSNCSKATGVSASYSACLSDLKTWSCDDLAAQTFPGTCNNVIEGDN